MHWASRRAEAAGDRQQHRPSPEAPAFEHTFSVNHTPVSWPELEQGRQRGSGGGAMGATATVCWGEARWSLATPIAGLEHGAPGANAAAETAERTTMNLIEDVADELVGVHVFTVRTSQLRINWNIEYGAGICNIR